MSDWGKSVVEVLAKYLKEKEPNLKGFSNKNLWRMKQFYETYKNSPHCGDNLENTKLATLWQELRSS